MKKYLPILLINFVLSGFIPVYGQYFAPIGARWYFDGSANGQAPMGSEYFLYEVVGDTLLAGKFSRVVNITYSSYFNGIQPWGEEYFYTENGKVFYYRYGKFNLLYDFQAVPGDTVWVTDPQIHALNVDTLSPMLVDSVTIEYFNSVPLKVFYTHSVDLFGLSYRGPVVENIGALDWFLPRGDLLPPETEGPMRCYSDELFNFSWAPYPCDQNAFLDVGSEFPESLKVQKTYSGNWHFSLPQSSIEAVEWMNLEGKTKSVELPAGQSEFELELPKSGLYVVRVRTQYGKLHVIKLLQL